MGRNDIAMSAKKMGELYEFLAEGVQPEGIFINNRPKLGRNKASSVIYFLQEHMEILPDTWEQCCSCKDLYDSESEGGYDERGCRHYCEPCYDRIMGY